MPLIEIQNLVKHYGPIRAVDDLSFGVEAGAITGFLGPNGSGKTTTLRALLGLLTPTSGSATIGGKAYRALAAPLREVGAMLEAAAHPGSRRDGGRP
jgi:ABC-2 type transport system ATP-binding protein